MRGRTGVSESLWTQVQIGHGDARATGDARRGHERADEGQPATLECVPLFQEERHRNSEVAKLNDTIMFCEVAWGASR